MSEEVLKELEAWILRELRASIAIDWEMTASRPTREGVIHCEIRINYTLKKSLQQDVNQLGDKPQ